MTINNIISIAISRKWKKWGNLTKKKGSSYQCMRKGNKYIWIGHAFVENPVFGHALDWRYATITELDEFIT